MYNFSEFIFYLFPFFLVTFFLFFLFFKKRKKETLKRSMDMVLFSVKLPRYENLDVKNNKEEEKRMISKMEQFFSNFLYLDKGEGFFQKLFGGPARVVFEVASETGQGDISFYVSLPSEYENSLKKYVQGVYSGAVVEKVPNDYTIFEPGGEVATSYLKEKETFFIPLNTYEELGRDPLESIVNSVSGINSDEGAAVQVVLRPSATDLNVLGGKLLSKIIDEGKTLKEAVALVESGNFLKFLHFLGDLFSSKKESKETKKIKVDETVIEAVRKKIKKPGFYVNIRLFGVAGKKERAEEILKSMESAFSQFTSGINGFKIKRIKKQRAVRQAVYDFSFREFKKEQTVFLNSTEIASIYHFPLSYIESPSIKWVKSKEVAPPENISERGPLFLGEALYREERKKIYVSSPDDRRRHFYIIGQTGVGKTTLLREMIRQDIENGEGVGVVDPHGDLIEDTLANIPQERADDVVLFEPFDRERPCGLNMLEWETSEQRDFAISEMITIFQQLFPPEVIGPMFEYYIRNAMAALMADKEEKGTIAEIPRMFTDIDFMEKKVKKVSDPMIRNFWLREWRQTTGEARSNMLGYVVSKIGRFVTDEMMRNIIGQQESGFNLGKIMDEKKIFLANLSKGLTGEMNSALLGLVLVSKMQMAALRRARIPEEERKDFYLYVDEFQNFTTNSVATILSEARKYHLNLVLAHQYMPQLKEEIKNAVVGNVGTTVSFRVGADDAEFLEKQFSPEFSRFDLGNLDNHQYVIRMMINGKTASPFKASASYPVQGDKERAKKVKEVAKAKYGKPKNIVEAEIIQRAKLGI